MPVATAAQDLPAESPIQVCNLYPGNAAWCERHALAWMCGPHNKISLPAGSLAEDRVLTAASFPNGERKSYENRR